MADSDTQVAHCTLWFTILTLDTTGEPPTTTLIIYSLLMDMEGVHRHNDRILISTPTEGAHDTVLQGVLGHLQVGGARVCPCICTSGRGRHNWVNPPPPTTAPHHQLHQHTSCGKCTPLVRLHCRPIALLQLTAALLCRAAALCLLRMPTASVMAIPS